MLGGFTGGFTGGCTWDRIESAWGPWIVAFSAEGLHHLWPREVLVPAWPEFVAAPQAPLPAAWRLFLESRCAARSATQCPPKKNTPPLVLRGTDFQRAVWAVLQEIPWGEVRSYSEIARAVGHPGAARAVGSACGANPLPLLVPCHRVVAAHGRLGGVTWGTEWKRRLLATEGFWVKGADVG